MHTVLHLEADWSDTETYETFEERLVETCFGSAFAHDDGAELAVVTDQNDVLGTFEDWNEGFRLSGLGSFIYEDLSEAEISDATVKCSHTSGANDVSVSQDLIFGLSLEIFELLFISLV